MTVTVRTFVLIVETEDQKQTARSIEIETLKSHSHAQTLAKETAETAEMHAAISTLTTHRSTLLGTRGTLQAELKSLQSTLSARRDLQAKHAKYLTHQSRFNIPELQFWEDHLCMRIDGCGHEDRLKFAFTHVCEKDWEKEAWFELDTGSREYQVLKTGPKLDGAEVDACVEALNQSRELGPFFKGMREAFVKAMK